ncbi:protein gp37 [Kaistia soli DSM 19436]|uniref:Protein gp37 n=1 Tax=Kaistia soli DSM 19436 TaxID=1122133 RepID=A0A1M4VDU7_9HYPH|nr:phage Gp37/Gp68 family protein [Kaistia soli]SHE67048.1 protein gp37 [Kaistia soli DSM 19436]
MTGKSPIEWCEQTWNPIVGCSIVSPGCTNCYAIPRAYRIRMASEVTDGASHYCGTVKLHESGKAIWTGKVALAPDSALLAPLRRRKPTTYFVNSMGDLFHESIPDEWIDRVFAVMALSPQHTFQVLTKRSARMRAYLSAARAAPVGLEAFGLTLDAMATNPKSRVGEGCILQGDIVHLRDWPLRNVWLGISAEDQRRADERMPDLLATPAAVRFVSAEPLLGSISFRWAKWDGWRDSAGGARSAVNEYDGLRMLDWIIVGGESGPGARPMHPDWARSIRDQCAAAGVAFFFKQWGAWAPAEFGTDPDNAHALYQTEKVAPFDSWKARVYDPDATEGVNWRLLGKARSGRLLDGVLHDAMPARASG